VWFVSRISSLLVRLLGGTEKPQGGYLSTEELKLLVETGSEQGGIEEEEKEMIHGVIELGDKRVHEVMVPRIGIRAVNVEDSLDEVLDMIIRAGHSRLPVFEESLDNILGILYAKDLLPYLKGNGFANGTIDIRTLVRPTDHVVLDRLSHACLMEGAKAATDQVHVFEHLSGDDLERTLARIRASDPTGGILVVTESLFSMDSDTPDLRHAVRAARAAGALLMVDCAHDLGAIGPDGTGHLGLQGVLGEVDVVMGSFSKTFASNGGFVAGIRLDAQPEEGREALSWLFSRRSALVWRRRCGLAMFGRPGDARRRTATG